MREGSPRSIVNRYRNLLWPWLAATCRRLRRLGRAPRLLILACGLALVASGCAVHYGNTRSGIERAWGVGSVTWRVAPATNGWAAVSSGTRLPGLVIGVGPDFLGVALGYQVRERLQVASSADLGETRAHINGRELAATAGAKWGFGQLTLRTPADSKIAVVSGRAGAGVGLGLEGGRPAAAVGWQSRQLTTVSGNDVLVELTTPACTWPHFDFLATDVVVMAATNLTLRSIEP